MEWSGKSSEEATFDQRSQSSKEAKGACIRGGSIAGNRNSGHKGLPRLVLGMG